MCEKTGDWFVIIQLLELELIECRVKLLHN